MTPTPITVSPTETLTDAMELMAMKKIRHLPVIDADGKLIGMVTDRDLRRAAPSPFANGSGAEEQAKMDTITVDKIMVRSPWTVTPTTQFREVLMVFVDKKYGALPVLENDRLVGIITPIDVMRAWLKMRG